MLGEGAVGVLLTRAQLGQQVMPWSWDGYGEALRKRKAGVAAVTDPDAGPKKS